MADWAQTHTGVQLIKRCCQNNGWPPRHTDDCFALCCPRTLPDCVTFPIFDLFSHSTGFWLLPQQTRGWAGWGSALFCRRRSNARRYLCEVQSRIPFPVLALPWTRGCAEAGCFRKNRACCWVPQISTSWRKMQTHGPSGWEWCVWRLPDLFCHRLNLHLNFAEIQGKVFCFKYVHYCYSCW